jgi:hypothetical protein
MGSGAEEGRLRAPERRSMTSGQKAMAYAFACPDSGGKRGRGNKGKLADSADFGERTLRDARAILHWSRDRAEEVRDGG